MKKILHRIFFNFDDGPDPFLSYLESWKKELPDFEIKHWDKTNLPLDLNEYTRIMAKEKNHAFLSDFFRCWVLEQYGGMYLDADIEILDGAVFRNIYSELQSSLDYDFCIGIESQGNGMLTAHSMGSKIGSHVPLLSFMMDLYTSAFTGPLQYAIKKFDMPFLLSLYFIHLEKTGIPTGSVKGFFPGKAEEMLIERMKIYPQDFFSPVTTRGGLKVISAFSANTCLCHHFAATWKDSPDTQHRKAATFTELLSQNKYSIMNNAFEALSTRYPSLVRHIRPMWHLKNKEIEKIEKLLNRIVPYGSPLYKILKKRSIQS